MNETPTKTCRMCRMEIHAEAKKCPHCHQLQNKLSQLISQWGHIVVLLPLLVILIFIPLMTKHFINMFEAGEEFAEYSSQVIVTESDLSFGERDGEATVCVIGRVKNQSPIDWKEISLQVAFFDSLGNLIDADQDFEYYYKLPAGTEIAFKVSFPREFPQEIYNEYKVSVIHATELKDRW